MITELNPIVPEEVLNSIKHELVFGQSTTAKKLFAASEPDEKLGLATAPLYLGHAEIARDRTMYMAVIDRPLLGRSLLRLLSATAPVPKFRNSLSALIYDFELYDHTDQESKKYQHEHDITLGEHIELFKQYRKDIIANLHHAYSPGLPYRDQKKEPTNVEEATRYILAGFGYSLAHDRSVSLLDKIPDFKDELAAFIPEEGSVNPDKFPRNSRNQLRERYRRYFQSLQGEERRKLALMIEGDGLPGHLEMVEPVIVWETTSHPDGGKRKQRKILLVPLNSDITSQLNNQLTERGQEMTDFLHYNPLVGFLTIPYFIPSIGDAWRRKMRLQTGVHHPSGDESLKTRPNEISEQAVLVLTSMMKEQIMREGERFFRKSEGYFE